MKNQKLEAKLDERKSGFISDLGAILKEPREKLFNNGELDTEKFSTFLNNFVKSYLQETVKECNFTKEQLPKVAVQELITTPPGDPSGSRSFGNYNTAFNFIEVNKNQFRPDMSDAALSQRITTALIGVSHEFRHFVQSAYSNDGVPESKVVSDRKLADATSKSFYETKISLETSQKTSLEISLGGKEKAECIKDDMLYGYGKMGLISIAKQNQDKTSAYADGNNAARNLKFLGNRDNRDPIIQAYYYNLEHEIDARNSAPSVVFNLAKDCGVFSKNFIKLAKESINQYFAAKVDNIKQPKNAINQLINTACGNKKGDPGITADMIENYYNANPETLKILKPDQMEYVEGSIVTLLTNLPKEKKEPFIESLNATNISPELIEKSVKIYKTKEASITPITKEDIIKVNPNHFKQTNEGQPSKNSPEIQKDIDGKTNNLDEINLE